MKSRAVLLLAALGTVLGTVLALVSPGLAAQAYPPTTCAMLSVSTTTPHPGQQITVGGSHFKPDASVTIALDNRSDVLAHVTTSARGSFSTRVTLPANMTGRHTLKAYGGQRANVTGCPAQANQAIRFQAGGESSSAAPSSSQGGGGNGGQSNGGGGTAFTGVDIAALLVVALALIGVGVLMNRRGTAKRAATSRQ